MIDFAELVIAEQGDRRGAKDALRDVRKQWRRIAPSVRRSPTSDMPVVRDDREPVGRSRHGPGVRAAPRAGRRGRSAGSSLATAASAPTAAGRSRADRPGAGPLSGGDRRVGARLPPRASDWRSAPPTRARSHARSPTLGDAAPGGREDARRAPRQGARQISTRRFARRSTEWPETRARYEAEEQSYQVRDKTIRVAESQARRSPHSKIPKVALPRAQDWGELTRFLRARTCPDASRSPPGVFPFKREGEDPVAHVRGRRPAGAHEPALPLRLAKDSRRCGSRPRSTA